jgi:small subunit ribosomal protein S1
MSQEKHHSHYFTSPDTQVEESYWSSLLSEGEYSKSVGFTSERTILENHELPTFTPSHLQDPQSDWDEAHLIMQHDEVLELNVIGFNRGGLLVEWRSLRGFVPASQLVEFTTSTNLMIRQNAMNDRIGQSLRLRIIEINVSKNRLILSERAAQVESGTRDELLNTVQVGDILTGTITNLVEFGAFADLGGIEGLIHISELSWGRVSHPSDILRRGETIELLVLEVAVNDSRIALSLKRLHPDPWAEVEQRFQIGQIIEGTITNVVDFGAFACVEDGLEGLIHFSELAEGHFLHPRNVVSEGDVIRARILTIDGKSRRLGLTLRLS